MTNEPTNTGNGCGVLLFLAAILFVLVIVFSAMAAD